MRRFVSIACLGVLSLSCTCVLAQHADDGSRTPVDPDAGTKGVIQTPDDVMDRMIGVWQRASQAQTDDESTQVSEQLGICQIQVQDLPHAMYVEHAIGMLGPDPKSQRVLSVYESHDGLRLRLWNFKVEQRADVLAGMWASPEDFPTIKREELFPVADFAVNDFDEHTLTSKTIAHASIDRDGAVYYDAVLNVYGIDETNSAFVFQERGFDAEGNTVFDTTPEPWTRIESPAIVNRLSEGVITIDYYRPEGIPAFDSNIMFLKYTMHIGSGSMTDNTERHGGIFRESLPVRQDKFLGWQLGLRGMTEGSRRLIIMPPGTGAYGDTETLYARIELVQLEQDVPPDQP